MQIALFAVISARFITILKSANMRNLWGKISRKEAARMPETLNFVFLLVCIIILSIRLVITGGRISKLEGRMDSLDIYLKELKEERGGEDG